jgi:hypothetical protein
MRWHYNRDTGVDSGDFFIAQVSSNNGSSWTTLENLNQSTSANSWTQRTFALESFITLTASVRIRFGSADGTAAGNIIESAIDDLYITTVPACFGAEDCDDTNICNGAEDCVSGACAPGTPLVCDDGVACTDDSCNPATGCVFAANDGNCADDGAFCTGTEFCNALTGCASTGDPCGSNTWCDEASAGCITHGDGDMDDDGDHDLLDFALFQACFGAPAGPACHAANLSGSAMIDQADLEMFIDAMSGGNGPN